VKKSKALKTIQKGFKPYKAKLETV